MLSYARLGINAKKCPCEEVIIPAALYEADVWGMGSDERRKANVFEMKYLRSVVGVSRIGNERVRIEEVRRRAGTSGALASRADQRVLDGLDMGQIG